MNKFNAIFTSDLSRSYDTANIALGFPPNINKILKKEVKLRELNFGKEEGIHYDSLPDERKLLINDLAFKA